MESASQNNDENTFDSCKACGRALSQKTGECYYCKERVDKETEKNLSLIMLDWQQQAVSDPDQRQKEKARKTISTMLVLIASACVATGIARFVPYYPSYYFIICGALVAICCWCFYFNSLTLILTTISNLAVFILYTNSVMQSIPDHIGTAFICGAILSMPAFVMFIITLRIFKSKTIEL
jgi:hypothetical protein